MSAQFSPAGEFVILQSGKKGVAVGVISWWGNHRCWDVYVEDPDHRADAPFCGYNHNVRGAQVRYSARTREWKEVQL